MLRRGSKDYQTAFVVECVKTIKSASYNLLFTINNKQKKAQHEKMELIRVYHLVENSWRENSMGPNTEFRCEVDQYFEDKDEAEFVLAKLGGPLSNMCGERVLKELWAARKLGTDHVFIMDSLSKRLSVCNTQMRPEFEQYKNERARQTALAKLTKEDQKLLGLI
jgi:hypothetical protein